MLRGSVHKDDKDALRDLMATGKPNNLHCKSRGPHKTDPETGSPKGGAVTVTEYSLGGDAGRRATRRVENGLITYYYSPTHEFNTYTYKLLL